MIAACPSCGARYRIDPERLGSGGVRLRCSRCESVFRVRPPVAPQPDPPVARVTHSDPAPSVATRPQPAVREEQVASEAAAHQPQDSGDSRSAEQSRLVLIADSEVEAGKATAHAVASWGLDPVLVHDGVEAIMSIQRMLPRVVVMDAALPKMFGFQVCEVLKRNESLRDIHVVLVGAIHKRERYRRPPTELYGADSYVERPELVERLRGILDGIGMPTRDPSGGTPAPVQPDIEQRPAPQPSIRPESVATPEPAPTAPEPAPAPLEPTPELQVAKPVLPKPGPVPVAPAEPKPQVETISPPETPLATADPGVVDAERLARIVVSDIILYNQEKFDTGVRDGNVLEAMASDLAEGRSLFNGRVDQSVRGERDFLAERLLEVARERGMS